MFIALLSIPLLNGVFKAVEYGRVDENRVFRDSLELDINKLDAFPEEAEEYFNDNFSFRTPLLNSYHHIKFNYFGVSPHPEQTIVGKDGWYFLAGQELKIFEGRVRLSNDQLHRIKIEWINRKQYFDQKGIKYYWMICPSKHEIYPEKLPFYAVQSKEMSRVDQLKETMKDDFPNFIIDPREALKATKKEHNVYFQLDNHWNYIGAREATRVLIDRIAKDFPDKDISMPDNFFWDDKKVQWGFHYTALGISSLSSTDYFPRTLRGGGRKVDKYGFTQESEYSYEWEFEERYKNPKSKSDLRVLIIRDSFGDYLRPFIKEAFGESVMIFDYWEYKLNEEIIDTVKPDIVIYENISRFLEVYAGEEKVSD